MRYRVTQAFTDAFGTNWSPGDKFRAHEDDDAAIYYKAYQIEDMDKPPGNNPPPEPGEGAARKGVAKDDEDERKAKAAKDEAEAKNKKR